MKTRSSIFFRCIWKSCQQYSKRHLCANRTIWSGESM